MASTRQILRHKAHQMKLRIRLREVFEYLLHMKLQVSHQCLEKSEKIAALSYNSLWQHLLFWHSPDALENLRTTPIGDNHFLWRTKHFGGRRGRKKGEEKRNREQRQLQPLASLFDLGFVKETVRKPFCLTELVYDELSGFLSALIGVPWL